jgi:hypothetical protein
MGRRLRGGDGRCPSGFGSAGASPILRVGPSGLREGPKPAKIAELKLPGNRFDSR